MGRVWFPSPCLDGPWLFQLTVLARRIQEFGLLLIDLRGWAPLKAEVDPLHTPGTKAHSHNESTEPPGGPIPQGSGPACWASPPTVLSATMTARIGLLTKTPAAQHRLQNEMCPNHSACPVHTVLSSVRSTATWERHRKKLHLICILTTK